MRWTRDAKEAGLVDIESLTEFVLAFKQQSRPGGAAPACLGRFLPCREPSSDIHARQ